MLELGCENATVGKNGLIGYTRLPGETAFPRTAARLVAVVFPANVIAHEYKVDILIYIYKCRYIHLYINIYIYMYTYICTYV